MQSKETSGKKTDEDDAKTADPFGVLRPKVKNAEQQQVNIYDMAKAYVFLADGFEDIEALAPVDILRRGGLNVKTVSINATDMVASAHGVQVKADMMFADADFSDADLLMLPGGMPGAKNLDEHEGVRRTAEAHRRHLRCTYGVRPSRAAPRQARYVLSGLRDRA